MLWKHRRRAPIPIVTADEPIQLRQFGAARIRESNVGRPARVTGTGMTLNGFIDDSGSGEGKDRGNIFVLAGFVACPKQWEQFSHKWQTICDREPKTPDFKMQTA